MGKTVFVTVGTTSFDTLVEVVSSESLCDVSCSRNRYMNVIRVPTKFCWLAVVF